MRTGTYSDWHEITFVEYEDTIDPNPRKLRILADQNIPQEMIEELKNARFQIITVGEMGLNGHPDENIREYAKKKQRVISLQTKIFGMNENIPFKNALALFVVKPAHRNLTNCSQVLPGSTIFFPSFTPMICGTI